MNQNVAELAEKERWDEVKRLIEKNVSDVNQLGGIWEAPPLYYAAAQGNLGICKWLVSHKADVKLAMRYGDTALHVAKNKDVCEYLISCGADVLERNLRGEQPLHKATMNEVIHEATSIEVIQCLVSRGADVKSTTGDGDTALHRVRSKDACEYLIFCGADVLARNSGGEQPLHNATSIGVIRCLVSHGADVRANNDAGNQPLHKAILKQNADVAITLLEHYSNSEEDRKALMKALEHCNNEILWIFSKMTLHKSERFYLKWLLECQKLVTPIVAKLVTVSSSRPSLISSLLSSLVQLSDANEIDDAIDSLGKGKQNRFVVLMTTALQQYSLQAREIRGESQEAVIKKYEYPKPEDIFGRLSRASAEKFLYLRKIRSLSKYDSEYARDTSEVMGMSELVQTLTEYETFLRQEKPISIWSEYHPPVYARVSPPSTQFETKQSRDKDTKQTQDEDASPADFLLNTSTSTVDLIVPRVHVSLSGVCTLLDTSDPLGDDWRALWTELTRRTLQEDDEKALEKDPSGPTIAVMKKWHQQCLLENATVGHLLISLKRIHRNDAAELLRGFLKEKDNDFLPMTIDSIPVLLSGASPLVSKHLTPAGLKLSIADDKCTLSIPSNAVDKPIKISSCLLADDGEYYKSKTGNELTDVVQLRPHGTKFKTAVTLKLKHNYTFRKNHAIKVTLLYESGTDSKKSMMPLCIFTALNQIVRFRFGRAVLLADQIIVHTTSFCHLCARNDGCCFNVSALVFALTDLSPAQFRDGFTVKLCFCKAKKRNEKKVKLAECGRKGSHSFEVVETRKFSLCKCGLSEDEPLPIVAEISKIPSTVAWSVDGSHEVRISKLRAISKGNAHHETYNFVLGSGRSHEVGDNVTASFILKSKDEVKITVSFEATVVRGGVGRIVTQMPSALHQPEIRSPKESLGVPVSSNLDCTVTEEELQELAPLLIEHWKTLAHILPGNKVNVAVVERKHQLDPNSCPYSMLHEWLNRNGSDATVRCLCTALIDPKVGHKFAAEKTFGIDVVRRVKAAAIATV